MENCHTLDWIHLHEHFSRFSKGWISKAGLVGYSFSIVLKHFNWIVYIYNYQNINFSTKKSAYDYFYFKFWLKFWCARFNKSFVYTLHKKTFSLKIFLVNANKSIVICGFVLVHPKVSTKKNLCIVTDMCKIFRKLVLSKFYYIFFLWH